MNPRTQRPPPSPSPQGYTGLHSAYTGKNFLRPFNDKFHILSPGEMRRMEAIGTDAGGGCYREAIAWCLEDIRALHASGRLDTKTFDLLANQILQLRSKLGVLFDFADQPIPFIYRSVLSWVSVVYLAIFSFGIARNLQVPADRPYYAEEVIGGLFVLISNLFVVGLQRMALKLHDPFDAEIEDLSVTHYVTFTITACRRILWGDPMARLDAVQEALLELQRPDLGSGFEGRHERVVDWQMEEDEEEAAASMRAFGPAAGGAGRGFSGGTGTGGAPWGAWGAGGQAFAGGGHAPGAQFGAAGWGGCHCCGCRCGDAGWGPLGGAPAGGAPPRAQQPWANGAGPREPSWSRGSGGNAAGDESGAALAGLGAPGAALDAVTIDIHGGMSGAPPPAPGAPDSPAEAHKAPASPPAPAAGLRPRVEPGRAPTWGKRGARASAPANAAGPPSVSLVDGGAAAAVLPPDPPGQAAAGGVPPTASTASLQTFPLARPAALPHGAPASPSGQELSAAASSSGGLPGYSFATGISTVHGAFSGIPPLPPGEPLVLGDGTVVGGSVFAELGGSSTGSRLMAAVAGGSSPGLRGEAAHARLLQQALELRNELGGGQEAVSMFQSGSNK